MSHLRLSIIGDSLIEVEDSPVTPAAPHLFALLLLLSLRQGKPIGRPEIQALLLGDAAGSTLASHSLRQLLYRLRQLGLSFHEQASGLTLCDTVIGSPMGRLREMDTTARSRLTTSDLEVLPTYAPRLSKPFSNWLDEIKSDLDSQIRTLLLSDLQTLHASHAWRDVIRLCETLGSLDAGNDAVVRSRAEALAMTGRREEALRVLDEFSRETVLTADAAARLQCVRTRIAKTAVIRREGTLRARGTCLSFLDAEWGKLSSEGARLSAVIGHAGLGKTRVAEEFAARISIRGGQVVRFDCDSQSQQQPLALFSHILPSLRAMRGSLGASPEYKSALALVRPSVDSVEPALPEGLSLEARRADIQSALIDLLEAVTEDRALLLIVDDAHLLDEASRSVLRSLATTRNAAAVHVLVCARPSSGNATLLAPARRGSVFELAPLSGDDSRELLLELSADRNPDDEYVAWSLKQAAGNPFYLHQLAAHSASSSTALPFDISSLALSCYSSLRPESRTVLETCLLLGRFATMNRAVSIAGIDDHTMLAALRELEEQDLVHFAEGLLTGPHALLHDALRGLIPSSVSALLHRRIAAKLEEDCVAEGFTPSLAWASAQSWLAAGDPAAATHLLRRCAGHAAGLGEPATAAQLLSQAPIATLPLALRAELLDDLSRFASSGGSHEMAVSALRGRLLVAHGLAEGDKSISSLELRIVEAELASGGSSASAFVSLRKLLADSATDPSLRAQAAVRMLVLADRDLDREAAELAHNLAVGINSSDPNTDTLLACADLVYHTTFGKLEFALALAARLLASFPQPNASECCFRARSYAAYAFHRMGYADRAQPIMEVDYAFAMSIRQYNEALYTASFITEMSLTTGDFGTALLWFAKCEVAARGVTPNRLSPYSGFDSNAGILAMREGRYDDAESHFLAPLQHSLLSAPRFRSFKTAMLLRVEQCRSGTNLGKNDLVLLRDLYEKGKRQGGQDSIVEALWCSLVIQGDSNSASQLLKDYLCLHRRERNLPEWSLRHVTAADDAWQEYFQVRERRETLPTLSVEST